jgi:hypothetical protein
VKRTQQWINPSKELRPKVNVHEERRAADVLQINKSGKPAPQKDDKAPAKTRSAAWLVPVGLLLLSAFPLAVGAFRLGAGWAINVVVAEWIIRKRSARPAGTTTRRPIQRRRASFSGGHA